MIVATDDTFQHVIDEAFTHVDAYAPRAGSGLINYPDTNTSYAWAVLPAQDYDGSSAGDDPTENGSYPQTFDFHSVQPSPVAPLTGATVTSQPTFSWTPVEAADHYVLQVSPDASFGSTVGGTPVQTTATSFTGTNFPAGNLYWRVQAVDASGNGLSWTVPQQFTMSYAAPTFTGNGSSYTNPTTADAIPVLHWDSMPGATSYELKIYNGTTTPTLDVQNISSTAYAPLTLKGTGQFTWAVYARYPTSGADVASPASATQSFTRSIAAPDGLIGDIGNQHSVLMSWNPKAGAASYAIQVSTENTFTTGVFDSYTSSNRPESTVLAPTLTPNQYTEGGSLFWRIATVDGDGNQGAWSTPQTLTLPQRIHASASPIAIQHRKDDHGHHHGQDPGRRQDQGRQGDRQGSRRDRSLEGRHHRVGRLQRAPHQEGDDHLHAEQDRLHHDHAHDQLALRGKRAPGPGRPGANLPVAPQPSTNRPSTGPRRRFEWRETPGSSTTRWVSGRPARRRSSCSWATGLQRRSTSSAGAASSSPGGVSRCSAQSRSRVARASPGSCVTTFISVSLKSECSFRLAEPTVSQRSSTMPTFACT